MARQFSKNASNHLRLGAGAIQPLINGAGSLSVHAWVKPASTTTAAFDNWALGIYINGSGVGIVLALDKTGANRVVRLAARSEAAGVLHSGLSTSDLALGAWHSIGGVINIAGDMITPYANGAAEGATAAAFASAVYTGGTPTGFDSIGANTTPTTAAQLDGDIAEVAIWTGALSANAFAALARGVSPGSVTGSNGNPPVFWMPLWGLSSPETCLRCGVQGTITGAVPRANHAPVAPFSSRLWGASAPLIEVAGGVPRQSMYYQRLRAA